MNNTYVKRTYDTRQPKPDITKHHKYHTNKVICMKCLHGYYLKDLRIKWDNDSKIYIEHCPYCSCPGWHF